MELPNGTMDVFIHLNMPTYDHTVQLAKLLAETIGEDMVLVEWSSQTAIKVLPYRAEALPEIAQAIESYIIANL